MALSAFDDKSNEPQAADLKIMLGRTSVHWDSLVGFVLGETAVKELAAVKMAN